MAPTTLDQWATDKLSIFLGLDPETLQTQVLPYLNTFQTADAVAEHLQEMLGITTDTTDFIQEYISRRFVSPPVSKQSNSSNSAKTKRASTPVQLAQQNATTQAWANEKNVYRKKDVEEEYFVGKKNKSAIGSKSASADPSPAGSPATSRAPSPPPASQTSSSPARNSGATAGSSLLSDKLDKKKKKKQLDDSMDLEKALRELDINASVEGGKRGACQCQATKHPLLSIAPNCLSCGKIICTLEGPGPCTFCGSPVLSRDQQLSLIAEAKRRRAEDAQTRQHAATRKAPAPGAGGGTVAYAAKLGGNVIPRRVEEDDSEDKEKLRLAEEHKERLLEFDRTSAKRSKVIDQATDFTLPADRPNQWLSPQERAQAIKTQQANLRRLENTQTRKVMTIDLAGRRVTVENAPAIDDDEEEENGQVPERERGQIQRSQAGPRGSDGVSAGTYARNPLLGGMTPKFVRGAVRNAKVEEGKGKGKGKGAKEKDGKGQEGKGKEGKEKNGKVQDNKPKKEEMGEASGSAKSEMERAKSAVPRLQHDVEAGFAERMLIGGEDGERETVREPACG